MYCSQCEIKLSGEGPWQLPGGSEDISFYFTPGHTEGHVVMYYHPEQVHTAPASLFCDACFALMPEA